MAKLKKLFDVPEHIARGVRDGPLRITGGVVRNNAGQIVHILKDSAEKASRSSNPYILAAIAAAAIAAITYSVYNSNKKKRTAESTLQPSSEFPTIDPDAFEKAIRAYWESTRDQHLSLDEIRGLATELQTFIEFMESSDFQNAKISIDNADILEKLRDFHNSLRALNLKLQEGKQIPKEVPPALTTYDALERGRDGIIYAHPASFDVLDLAKQLREQLRFQEEVWPVYVESKEDSLS